MQNQRGKLGLGVVLGWCYAGLTLIVRYVRVPIILAFVSKAEYGVWMLLLSFVGMAMTSEIVTSQIVTREVSKLNLDRTTGPLKLPLPLLAGIDRLYLRLVVIGAVIFAGMSAFFPYLVKGGMPTPGLLLLWSGCASGALMFLYTAKNLAILDGIGEVWAGKLAKSLYELVGFAFLLAFLFLFHMGIYALGAMLFAQATFYAFLNRFLLKRFFALPQKAARRGLWLHHSIWRNLWNSCWQILSVHIGTTIVYLTAALLVPRLLGISVLADLGINAQLFQLTNFFALPLLFVWYPTLTSRIRERGDLSHGMGFLFGAAVLINICILVAAEPILKLWVGPGHFLGNGVLLVLAMCSILDVTQVGFRSILIAMGKVKPLNAVVWPATAANWVVAYVLAHFYGLVGILIGPLVAELILVVSFDRMLRPATSNGRSLFVSVLKRGWMGIVVLAAAIILVFHQPAASVNHLWLRGSVALAAAASAYISLDGHDRAALFHEVRHLSNLIVGSRIGL